MTRSQQRIIGELRALARLALPAIVTQVGTMFMGVVDTLMVARVGTDALAAITIANVWASLFLYCSMGLLFGLDPIVSQAHGAGDGPRAARALQSGVVLALWLSLPVAALYWSAGWFLVLLGQEPRLAVLGSGYLRVQLLGLPALLTYIALRQYLQGRTLVWPAVWAMLCANVLNALANWVLIFGHLGFPAMGLRGAGVATNAVRIALLILLVAWVWRGRLHEGAWVPWSWDAVHWRRLRPILAYGVPVWLQMLLEIGAFSGSSLLIGLLGVASLGAHAVALNLASLAFMVPLGVSIAASTRVGNLYGAGDLQRVRLACRVGLCAGAGVMCVSAAGFIALPAWLSGLYSDDASVLALCLALLPIAGAFQLFDGTQVVACGILRGLGRTRPAAIANVVGYWVLGLPFGVWLTFERELGVVGIWYGFLIGLGVVALALARLVWRGPAPR